MKRKAQNPAQAGDAVLAFHYAEYSKKSGEITYKRETTVHVNEKPDFFIDWYHIGGFFLEFWGPSKGIVNIPLLKENKKLYESVFAINFTKDDMSKFSHVIMKSDWTNLGGTGESRTSFLGMTISKSNWEEKGGTEKTERVEIYRLNDLEKSHIAAKIMY